MRVFYASAASANTRALRDSHIWEINLRETLEHMGLEVVLPSFDMDELYRESASAMRSGDAALLAGARARNSERLLDDVRKAHRERPLDLVFTYFSTRHVLGEAIDEIRALGVPTVNFYCNSVHQFHLVEEIAPHFDYCMFPEREAIESYRAVGANPVHVQMAANPRFYKPYPLPREFEVTFVGQRYLERPEYVHHLHANGVDVRVWGPGWQKRKKRPAGLVGRGRRLAGRLMRRVPGAAEPEELYALPGSRCGPPLSDEQLVKMYSRSAISLGFSEVQHAQTGEITRHIRLRDFEAPMSGALYFTGYQDELVEYYRIDEEIICYETKEELLDKVRYYLSHRSEGERVREAGLRRARRDHTWENRFRSLFRAVGLDYTP